MIRKTGPKVKYLSMATENERDSIGILPQMTPTPQNKQTKTYAGNLGLSHWIQGDKKGRKRREKSVRGRESDLGCEERKEGRRWLPQGCHKASGKVTVSQ